MRVQTEYLQPTDSTIYHTFANVKEILKGPFSLLVGSELRCFCVKPHNTRREEKNLGGWQGSHLTKSSHSPVAAKQAGPAVSTMSNKRLADSSTYNQAGWKEALSEPVTLYPGRLVRTHI